MKAMPISTPGTRNGSHSATPIGQRQPINPTTRQSVAPATAKENEFHMAIWPAAIAEGSSDHVSRVDASCTSGSTAEISASNTMQTPPIEDQPLPSCCRKRFGGTCPSVRGHATALCRNQINSSSGATIIGQLACNAAMVLNVVLNSTQTSAGNTFTCRIAGTAKLFSASTKVSTAASDNPPRANGSSNPRTSASPVTATSASSCDGSSRCHAPSTASNVIGQRISVK